MKRETDDSINVIPKSKIHITVMLVLSTKVEIYPRLRASQSLWRPYQSCLFESQVRRTYG